MLWSGVGVQGTGEVWFYFLYQWILFFFSCGEPTSTFLPKSCPSPFFPLLCSHQPYARIQAWWLPGRWGRASMDGWLGMCGWMLPWWGVSRVKWYRSTGTQLPQSWLQPQRPHREEELDGAKSLSTVWSFLEDVHNGTWLTESTIQTTTMLFGIEIGQELSKTHCVFDIVKQKTNKRQSNELMRAW